MNFDLRQSKARNVPGEEAKGELSTLAGYFIWPIVFVCVPIGFFILSAYASKLLIPVLGKALGNIAAMGVSGLVCVLIVGMVGAVLDEWRHREIESAKEKIDREAKSLSDDGDRSDSGIILFLRPFSKEWSFVMYNDDFHEVRLPKQLVFEFQWARLGEFFDGFCKVLGGRYPNQKLVMIGDRSDFANSHAGSVKTSDDEWQEVAERIMARAALIFCVPDCTEGMSWEISRLINQYKDKSIFVVPPSYWYRELYRSSNRGQKRTGYVLEINEKHKAYCEDYRTQVARYLGEQYGLEYPRPSLKGCLFWYSGSELKQSHLPHTAAEVWSIKHHPRFGAVSVN